MEDTKLEEAIEETAEQSFNDSELQDIMSEIESLEKEFVEEGERSPEDLAIVSPKKSDLQSAIDKEVESMSSEMATDDAEMIAQNSEVVDTVDDSFADEVISEVEEETIDNVVTLPTSEKKSVSTNGAAMDFSAAGTMDFNLNFNIGAEAATLKVDGDKGLCVEMGGVVIQITQESGCTVTMEGGVNFNIPLTTSTNAAKKKAA